MTTYNTDYDFFPSGPINTANTTDYTTSCSLDKCILHIHYNDSNIKLTKNSDSNLELLFDYDNFILFNNNYYKLDYVTFSHKLNNISGDLEIYMVHTKCEDYKCESDKKLIFHILVNQSDDTNENSFFSNISDIDIDIDDRKLIHSYDKNLNPFDILPDSKNFYQYGSDNLIQHILFENFIYINENTLNNILDNLTLFSSPTVSYINNVNYSSKTIANNSTDNFNIFREKSYNNIYKKELKYDNKNDKTVKIIYTSIIGFFIFIVLIYIIFDYLGINLKNIKILINIINLFIISIFNKIKEIDYTILITILIISSILLIRYILIKTQIIDKLFPYNTDTEVGINISEIPQETLDYLLDYNKFEEDLITDLFSALENKIN